MTFLSREIILDRNLSCAHLMNMNNRGSQE
jgi:hypothetical protein